MAAEIIDVSTGEISPADALPMLPEEPGRVPTAFLASACQQIYEHRNELVGALDAERAIEMLGRTCAIERYVRAKEHKEAARRAQRVLEAAVGEALPDAETAQKGGRGKKVITCDHLSHGDRMRFRLMARYREAWWEKLSEVALSRKQVLELIDRARNPDDAYEVGRDFCTVDDLQSLASDVISGRRAPFGTIYADPPWQYGNQGTRGSNESHYAGETVEWLCDPANMPIADLVAPQAHLHLWTTNAFLFESRRLLEAWGFEYKSCYVWAKPQIGMGNYWRVSHEFMLLGVRGALGFATRNLRSWGEFKRRQHSAKPEEIRDLIHLASPGPRLELFARRAVEGWTCWGNEIRREVFAA